ncbi:rhomboid family intramembrane serine protease [Streptomyces sp. ISL-10]|uniref:rhomboid family intramembrane serine protease n=1 Tax=Streptomyces sp. ISL-10 TaxID=2819172 RepID=UPI001BE62720|nr:rhomboid family intramembrane serine protease [Streptomyces sp. ISL-10]MBT2368759.1 rhomboid family intramembrane serine protease [Streptomyces sp. ISL-10]
MADTHLAGRRSDRARAAVKLMLAWVALLWLLEAVDVATGHALDAYGVVSREPGELIDVVPSAFVHFGFGHVAANSVPLLIFGFLAALGGIRRFLAVSLLIILIDGVGVWLFSPANVNTAGASGLVFGLFGYLVARGFVERRLRDAVVGLLVGAVWGSSILAGISPANTGVSWQGHLFGLLAGVAAAFVFRASRPPRTR